MIKSALNIKVDFNIFKLIGFSILNLAFSRKNHFQAVFVQRLHQSDFFLLVVRGVSNFFQAK